MLDKLNTILNNFWVALSLAMVAFVGAMIQASAGETSWIILDLVCTGYWLFIAWRARSPKKPIGEGVNELTQDDINTLVVIRDNMTKLIEREQTKLDAKEKNK